MDFTVYDVALVPVVMGLVSVLKELGLPRKLAPVVALVIGVAAGVLYIDPADIKRGVLFGVVMGLSAIGTYSGLKNSVEAVRGLGAQDGADLN